MRLRAALIVTLWTVLALAEIPNASSLQRKECRGEIVDALLSGALGATDAYARIIVLAREVGIPAEDCFVKELHGREPAEPQFRYLAAAFGKNVEPSNEGDSPIPLTFKVHTYET